MSTIALNLDLADAAVLERAVASTLSACMCEPAQCGVDVADRAALAYIQGELIRMLARPDGKPVGRRDRMVGTGRAELRLVKPVLAPAPMRST